MKNRRSSYYTDEMDTSRRRFVQGLAAGGAVLGLGLLNRPAWALSNPAQRQVLRGTEFDLSISELAVNFTGQKAMATAVNGQIPAPELRWREGDTVTLRVTNHLKHSTSIHWHGIILPNAMDGVPGLTYAGIAPGETFTYRFKVGQSGTYWYHSHSGFQEQTGLYGPIVIEPRDHEPAPYDRDYVVMLSDWTDDSPDYVYSRLKKMDGYYNYAKLTLGDFIRQAKQNGLGSAWAERAMWDKMRMSPRDLADVSGATYTYLMNGMTPAGNWSGVFKPGEKVRLRVINGSAMSFFDVRIPGLKMTVVAADGQNVHPVSVDEFRIGVAETYDVIVEPQGDQAYSIFAQSMDRSGFTCGSLTSRMGMKAEAPALDPVPTLTMADMGMSMSDMPGMDMSGMQNGKQDMKGMAGMQHGKQDMKGMDMSGMQHGKQDMNGMDMAGMQHGKQDMKGMDMSGMQHGKQDMNGMDMAGMQHGKQDMKGMDMAGMQHGKQDMKGMDMSGMQHGKQDMSAMQHGMQGEMKGMDMSGSSMMKVTHHAATEYGPGTAMHADEVSRSLSDPGAGLRNNGRRVLTYADLKSRDGWLDQRQPGRTIEIHLTGNMERYMWSFDGVKFSDAEPIKLHYGEVVRIVLVNDTMMDHPIHLHGLWSEIETPEGGFQVRKHTVVVKPGHTVSYRVLADAKGRWAYHCHLLYHMKAGMFREVQVI